MQKIFYDSIEKKEDFSKCAVFVKLGCVIIHIDRIILRCISPIILRIKVENAMAHP